MGGNERVDLYGYASMAVATLQVQGEQIAQLRREVAALQEQIEQARAGASCVCESR